jgi:acyl-CoA thioesterase FadM
VLYWHFRSIQCIVAALFKPRVERTDIILTKTFTANPFDSDWMNSIQAGAFFTYTDSARWELAVRMGFLKAAFQHRWVIIIGGQKIIYRKPVRLFRRFQITMQFTGWDDKWIYCSHVFRQNGEEKAVVLTKAGLRCGGKLLNPHEAFKKLGYAETQPAPAWIIEQFEKDVSLLRECSQALPASAD